MQRVTGDVQLAGKKLEDYLWVTRDELAEYLDKNYLAQMRGLLQN